MSALSGPNRDETSDSGPALNQKLRSGSGQVVVVGSVALDTIEGPGGHVKDILGGSATYATYAAGFFAPVKLVACIGEDFPDASLRVLGEKGADLSGLQKLSGKTFRWAGRYGKAFRGRETLSLDLGVFMKFEPALGGPLPRGSILLLGNIDPDLQLKVLEQAGGEVFVAADTIDHWIINKPEALKRGLKRTNLLFVNDEEAELLTGESNMIRAGAKLRALGPAQVVIKKGEHGALLFSAAGVAALPAYPLERVVDPTGAGDVFAGAVLGWLAAGTGRDEAAMRAAMARATVLSSFVVEEFSVERLRRLKSGELEDRVARLRALVKF